MDEHDLATYGHRPAFYSAPTDAAYLARLAREAREFSVERAHTAARREREAAMRQQEDMVADGWPDDPAGV